MSADRVLEAGPRDGTTKPGRRPPEGQASARRHNLALVLRLLADGGPRSRAALADATGLTKATVSALVTDLAERGLVRDADVVQGNAGRPSTMVAVGGSTIVGLGVAIDVDEIRLGAVDLGGSLSHERTLRSDNRGAEPRTVVRRAARATLDLLHTLAGDGRRAVGLQVAVPGLVAGDTAIVAPNLGWSDVAVGRWLREQLATVGAGAHADVHVGLENEANAAALAESRARSERTFLHVSAGVGVGAGVVLDGRIFRGAHGFGGELGHFVVDPGGQACHCGNRGCLETVVGRTQFLRAAGVRSRTGVDDGARLEIARTRALAGDAAALGALDRTATALATALASAVSLLDPQVVVLGGYLLPLTPLLAPTIESALGRRVLGARYTGYPVRASSVGAHATVIGAGWSALERVLADPTVVAPR